MSRGWTKDTVAIYNMKRNPTPPTVRQAKLDAKAEKELHEIVIKWLRMKGIRIIVHSRTDRATTNAVGTADILFAINGQAVAIELKVGDNKPTTEQEAWLKNATEDGWVAGTAWSLDGVIAIYQRAESLPQPFRQVKNSS